MGMPTSTGEERPKCGKCDNYLHSEVDKLKSTDKYWKKCHVCRGRQSGKKRRRRGAPSRRGGSDRHESAKKAKHVATSTDVAPPANGTGATISSTGIGYAAIGPSPSMIGPDAQEASMENIHAPLMTMPRTWEYNEHEASDDDEDWVSYIKEEPQNNIIMSRETNDNIPASPSRKPEDVECSVCSNTFATDKFPRLKDCSHSPRIFQECFASWLKTQVENTSWDRIKCPADGCEVLVSHDDMRSLASQNTYSRYTELCTLSLLRSDPNFRYCLNPGCTSGQIHVGGNIFRCNACDHKFCTVHNVAFHDGETCGEYDTRTKGQRKAEDDASAQKIEYTTKQCPNEECRVRTQKNDGCDHMTCKWCQHDFCRVCSAPYQGAEGIKVVGNHAHQPDCLHWRDFRPGTPPYNPFRDPSLEPPLLDFTEDLRYRTPTPMSSPNPFGEELRPLPDRIEEVRSRTPTPISSPDPSIEELPSRTPNPLQSMGPSVTDDSTRLRDPFIEEIPSRTPTPEPRWQATGSHTRDPDPLPLDDESMVEGDSDNESVFSTMSEYNRAGAAMRAGALETTQTASPAYEKLPGWTI